jgi:hypothetical protein
MTNEIQDFSKLKKNEIEKIKKDFNHLILYASKSSDLSNINDLFIKHPFYKNFNIEPYGNHIICKFDVFSSKSMEWKHYTLAVFGKDKIYDLYSDISKKIKSINDEEQENDNDTIIKHLFF